jgi:hypothetical protein
MSLFSEGRVIALRANAILGHAIESPVAEAATVSND